MNSLRPQLRTATDSARALAYVSELVAVGYRGAPRRRLDSLAAASRGQSWFFEPPAADDNWWSWSRLFEEAARPAGWADVSVPVLLVYGAADERVPARQSALRIATALLHGGDNDVTVHIFPNADHNFRLPAGPSGWSVTAPGYVETLVDWLSERPRR
jgi:hypothetical protein